MYARRFINSTLIVTVVSSHYHYYYCWIYIGIVQIWHVLLLFLQSEGGKLMVDLCVRWVIRLCYCARPR